METKMKKRFKRRSDIVKTAVKNTKKWTPQEQLCRNVLRLSGIKEPSLETVQRVIRQQQIEAANKKYKELTNAKDKSGTL